MREPSPATISATSALLRTRHFAPDPPRRGCRLRCGDPPAGSRRLRALTLPKAMLDVAGRPFIDWQIEKLASCGFTDIVLCVAYLAEQIEAHVGDGSRLARACGRAVRVRYSHEGDKLLGTAGALR